MNNLTELQNSVIELLCASPELSRVSFLREFPGGMKPTPVRGIIVGVGIGAVEAQSGGLGDYFGMDGTCAQNPCVYGKRVSVTLRFSIYSQSATGDECTEAFFAIASRLMFLREGLFFSKISCDSPVYDRDMQTVMLTARAVCAAVLTESEDNAEFSDFSVRRDIRE